MSQAEIDVLAERQRQIYDEGFDEAHDESNGHDEIALAAACYALPERYRILLLTGWGRTLREALWHWAEVWWKPKDRRRDLVRAAALAIAEIDRMDRAVGAGEGGGA